MSQEYDIKQLLQSRETFGTTLHAALLAKYGPEIYVWEPETITLEVLDDYGVEIPSYGFNRWAAIQTIMTTDAFFRRVDAFMAVCNSLTSGEPYFTTFDPLTTEEIVWGITEAALNRELLPFSRAVKAFIKLTATTEGFSGGNAPEVIKNVLSDKDVREDIAETYRTDNNDILEEFIDEQMGALAFQLDQLPGWKGQVHKFLQSDELVLPDIVEDK
jgi:hypothetical protein